MVAAASRGGLIIVLLAVAALYFSGAGGWLWNRVEQLGDQCYAAVASLDTTMGTPVCEAVAKGVSALGATGDRLHAKVEQLKERIGISSEGLGSVDGLAGRIQENIASLASPGERLTQLMGQGPGSTASGVSVNDRFQKAIDSFTIGQLYMKDANTAPQAVPWLQNGASQPEGFGVLSQLTLGNMYAQGGQGVAQNPQMAEAYLAQAKQSLSVLSGSNSAQSQQLLQSLPAPPLELQQQIDQAIRQLRLKK